MISLFPPSPSAVATLSGLYSARPSAASSSGASYYATDVMETYLSDGSAWTVIGTGAQRFYAELTTSQSNPTANTPTDITGLTCTIVVGERPILMEFDGHCSNNNTGANVRISFLAGGTLRGVASKFFVTGGTYETISKRVLVQGLTAGSSYTFKVQQDSQLAGTSTVYGDAGSITKSWFRVTAA